MAHDNDLKNKLAAALSVQHNNDAADLATGAAGKQPAPGRDRHGNIQPASDDIHGNVLHEIEAATGIETEDLIDDKALGEDLGVDSLSLVDLSVRLEERFGIDLSDSDINDSTTVRDLVNLVQRTLDAK